jgi:hypothetical protein
MSVASSSDASICHWVNYRCHVKFPAGCWSTNLPLQLCILALYYMDNNCLPNLKKTALKHDVNWGDGGGIVHKIVCISLNVYSLS